MNTKIFVIGVLVLSALTMIGAWVFSQNFNLAKKTPSELSTPKPGSASSSGTLQPDSKGQIHPVETVRVTLTPSGFEPKEVTVKKGGLVVWINKSGKQASVNSADHPTHLLYPPLNLGLFPDNSNLSLVFDQSGNFKYHNHLNPSQTGTVIVH